MTFATALRATLARTGGSILSPFCRAAEVRPPDVEKLARSGRLEARSVNHRGGGIDTPGADPGRVGASCVCEYADQSSLSCASCAAPSTRSAASSSASVAASAASET